MNWLKQAKEPLFPDILWSRPENKRFAGKLLIAGGHLQSFNDVSTAYAAANKAGIGDVRVILPDKLKRMLSTVFPEAEYAPSTAIGSFSRQALAALLDAAEWADAVLLAGDFGRNSETAILLENFIQKYDGPLSITGDTIDYFLQNKNLPLERYNIVITTGINKLQKLAAPDLIQQNVDLIKAVDQISKWVQKTNLNVVTTHSNQALVTVGELISTTPAKKEADLTSLAAFATVWWLQHPQKPFEALSTAAWCYTREL